jgi:putative transposase
MLSYEYKLRLSRAQQAALDEAIRTTQFIRNKCLRLWMDGRGVTANDLQVLCARLAQEYAFAARLNSQARQAAASRAWAAIERFYVNCRERRAGKKGYPRSQRDCRSVEYKQTGWQLDAAGKRRTRTDGCGIGRVRLIGARIWRRFPSSRSSACGWCGGRMAPTPSLSCTWSGASAMSPRAASWGSTWALPPL